MANKVSENYWIDSSTTFAYPYQEYRSSRWRQTGTLNFSHSNQTHEKDEKANDQGNAHHQIMNAVKDLLVSGAGEAAEGVLDALGSGGSGVRNGLSDGLAGVLGLVGAATKGVTGLLGGGLLGPGGRGVSWW
jgi:hypothetical protein